MSNSSNSINLDQNDLTRQDRNFAVQTSLTGGTVYALPRRTSKRNMMDLMMRIMDEDGPKPMINKKKTRNAADQFYDDHHGEYEAIGHTHYDQIERVHTHNNAYPKMYDELDKRRSIRKVGISGWAHQTRQGAGISTRTPQDSVSEYSTTTFDPTCPKCIKRKKKIEGEGKRRKRICKKCRDQRRRKEPRNKFGRVTKQKISKTFIPYIICSNKCFQSNLAAEMKSVSTFKSVDNLFSVPQEVPMTRWGSLKESQENIVFKSKSSHKKKVGKKPGSIHSDVNQGQQDTETGPSISIRTPQDSVSEYSTTTFDPTCPKCIKRKKKIEGEGKRRKRICKKCRDQRRRREPRNKFGRVTKQKISKTFIPYIICSNKCFQCDLAPEMKSVSTFKSVDNLFSVPQEVPMTRGGSLKESQENIVLKSKSSHKKKVGKKPGSHSDVNRQHDTESGPSASSYNSFYSSDTEPMV